MATMSASPDFNSSGVTGEPRNALLLTRRSCPLLDCIRNSAQPQPLDFTNGVEMVLLMRPTADERNLKIALSALRRGHAAEHWCDGVRRARVRRMNRRRRRFPHPLGQPLAALTHPANAFRRHASNQGIGRNILRHDGAGPTKLYSPSVTPQTMVAFAPIELPRRTSVLRYSFLRET